MVGAAATRLQENRRTGIRRSFPGARQDSTPIPIAMPTPIASQILRGCGFGAGLFEERRCGCLDSVAGALRAATRVRCGSPVGDRLPHLAFLETARGWLWVALIWIIDPSILST